MEVKTGEETAAGAVSDVICNLVSVDVATEQRSLGLPSSEIFDVENDQEEDLDGSDIYSFKGCTVFQFSSLFHKPFDSHSID